MENNRVAATSACFRENTNIHIVPRVVFVFPDCCLISFWCCGSCAGFGGADTGSCVDGSWRHGLFCPSLAHGHLSTLGKAEPLRVRLGTSRTARLCCVV